MRLQNELPLPRIRQEVALEIEKIPPPRRNPSVWAMPPFEPRDLARKLRSHRPDPTPVQNPVRRLKRNVNMIRVHRMLMEFDPKAMAEFFELLLNEPNMTKQPQRITRLEHEMDRPFARERTRRLSFAEESRATKCAGAFLICK